MSSHKFPVKSHSSALIAYMAYFFGFMHYIYLGHYKLQFVFWGMPVAGLVVAMSGHTEFGSAMIALSCVWAVWDFFHMPFKVSSINKKVDLYNAAREGYTTADPTKSAQWNAGKFRRESRLRNELKNNN